MAYLCEVLFTVFAGEMYQWITHNFKSGANSNNPLRGSVLKWTLTWQARLSGRIFGRSLCIKIFYERITFGDTAMVALLDWSGYFWQKKT